MSAPHTSRHGTRSGRRAVAALALASGLFGLTGCGGGSDTLVGYTLEPATQVGDLSLPDVTADEQPFALRAEAGRLLVVFFGYTNCPDVCPLTMSEVARARGQAGQPEDVAVAMISIDPERDTPDLLAGYVQGFVDDGHGLRTTDDEQLRAVADRFGASYAIATAADGSIEVSHTGNVYVVDDTGEVAVVWPFGTSGDDMANDLSLLLKQA